MPDLTPEQMEQPAKQWQMAAVAKELKDVNGKLDTLIEAAKSYATHADVEKVQIENQKYTDKQIKILKEQIDTKYSPLVKLFWALLTAVCIAVVTAVINIKSD